MRDRLARWLVRLAPLLLFLMGPCGKPSDSIGY